MKIALCFSGQPRFIKESASLIKENVIQDYDVDVFSHLWFDEGLQTKPYKYGGSGGWIKQRISDESLDDFIKLYNWSNQIEKSLKKNDLFILPSLYEGSPNILLDSINISLPVLSSDCSGARDILAQQSKFIFKVNDKQDLIKKLKLCTI